MSGCTIWFTGMSGAGKTTIATLVCGELKSRGIATELLDGDELRQNLCAGLGYSKRDRDTNVQRIGWVCDRLTRHGIIVCVAAISPYDAAREEVRARIGRFVLVHCDAPLATLEARDVKGLYRRARAGELASFTGISDPYEVPRHPDVVIRSDREKPGESAAKVLHALRARSYLPPRSERRPTWGQESAG